MKLRLRPRMVNHVFVSKVLFSCIAVSPYLLPARRNPLANLLIGAGSKTIFYTSTYSSKRGTQRQMNCLFLKENHLNLFVWLLCSHYTYNSIYRRKEFQRAYSRTKIWFGRCVAWNYLITIELKLWWQKPVLYLLCFRKVYHKA